MPKAASPFRTMSVQTAEYSFMRLTLNSSGGVSSSFGCEGGSFMKRPMVTATVMFQFEHFLIRNAQMYPDRLAFVYKDKSYTWSELNRAVNRLANSFTSIGLGKGDRAAYMFGNCAEVVLVFLATQKIGATAMPINTHFLSGEISRIMDVVDCKAVAYEARFSDTIHAAQAAYGKLSRMIVLGEPRTDELDLASLINGADDHEAQVDLSADDESVIILTSGTTGTSKAVLRTQSMMREYGLMLAIENDNSHRPEVALTHCPFFHTACLSIHVKMLALCGTFVLVDKVDSDFIFDQIEKYHVTMMLMVPPLLYMRLYDSGLWKKYDTISLREAQFTGGKCSMDYVHKIFTMFPNCKLRPSYGSTEVCASCSAVLSREEFERRPELCKTVGRINANCEMKLVDNDGNEVPVGEVGEGLVRSPAVFRGYIKNEELIAYCRANLPSYKKPRYVAFVDELPHNVTGKIQKSVLRENADKLFRSVRGL